MRLTISVCAIAGSCSPYDTLMKTEKPVERSVMFPERSGGYFWLHVSSTTGGAFDSAPCCAGMMTAVVFIPEDVSRRFYVICAAVHWCR